MGAVGQEPLENYRHSAGVGYLSLVVDLSRGEYIKQCYISSTVSIKMEDGSISHQVPVPLEVLNFAEFPLKVEDRGTPVVWVSEPVSGRPMVVARYGSNEELSDLEEGMFKFKRKVGNTVVEITGSTQGFLNITVDGDEYSKLNLVVHNKENSGELNLDVQGDVNVRATDSAIIKGGRIVEIQTESEEDSSQISVEPTVIKVQSERVELGDGSEPLLLGQKTLNFIEEFLDTIYASTVPTQAGAMPLINKESFKLLKEKLEELKSKISFTE